VWVQNLLALDLPAQRFDGLFANAALCHVAGCSVSGRSVGAADLHEVTEYRALLRCQVPDADVASFRFKAVRPTFALHPFRVNGQPDADGKTVRLWAQDHEGWLTMDAVATLRTS
jgi:hypothetical protein